MTRWITISAALFALGACDCSGDDVELLPEDGGATMDGTAGRDGELPPPIPGLVGLRVEPGTATVIDDGVAPGETTSYTAIGTFEGGEERDVTADVGWSLDHPDLGRIADGAFTSAGIGGRTRVRAAAGSISGDAELIVRLEAIVVVDGTPPGAEAMFPADTSGDVVGDTAGPRIVYPSHETMFPRNLERVDHQWNASAPLDLFELRFESDVALVRWYTTERHYLPTPDEWRWLAATHAGSSLELTVRAVSTAAPGDVYASQTITLYYSASEVIGALYYWSTGAAGVMKASISAPIATKFFTDPAGDDDTCVSCHTVSRNGRRLSAGYGGERLRAITIPDRTVTVPADPAADGPNYGWGTFSPDASRLLYSHQGHLTLLDAETAAVIRDVTLPDGLLAQHPDWAPSGDYVVVALGTADIKNKEVKNTSLARIPVLPDDDFGVPEVLLPSTGADDTIYFPSYSPDSRWIAFVRGVGRSKDNETSELFLLSADGSGDPILLTRLNERVRDQDGITLIGNSMPTWAPSTRPDIFWLAFSSLRDYGNVLSGTDRDQLWGAAIDPARIAAGEDPSYAAFWMPFQDLEEGNHRAFWVIDTEMMCPTDVEICDMLDNDCDGVVDEDCCTPVEEICGDGVDNDCDGAADEGCDCAPTETCNNGIDDDCDLAVDDLDEDCII